MYEKIGLLKKNFSWEESIFSYNQWNLDLNACRNAYSNLKHYKQMEKCFQIISMDIFLLIDTILGGIFLSLLGFYIFLAKNFDQNLKISKIYSYSCVLLRPKLKIRTLIPIPFQYIEQDLNFSISSCVLLRPKMDFRTLIEAISIPFLEMENELEIILGQGIFGSILRLKFQYTQKINTRIYGIVSLGYTTWKKIILPQQLIPLAIQLNLDLNAHRNTYNSQKYCKQIDECFLIISIDTLLFIDTILGGISMFYFGLFYILFAGILKKKFDQYFNFTIISCVLLRPKMKIRILTFFLSPEPKGSFISEAQSDWSLAFGKMLLTNELANTKKGSTLIPFTDSQSDWSLAFGKKLLTNEIAIGSSLIPFLKIKIEIELSLRQGKFGSILRLKLQYTQKMNARIYGIVSMGHTICIKSTLSQQSIYLKTLKPELIVGQSIFENITLCIFNQKQEIKFGFNSIGTGKYYKQRKICFRITHEILYIYSIESQTFWQIDCLYLLILQKFLNRILSLTSFSQKFLFGPLTIDTIIGNNSHLLIDYLFQKCFWSRNFGRNFKFPMTLIDSLSLLILQETLLRILKYFTLVFGKTLFGLLIVIIDSILGKISSFFFDIYYVFSHVFH